MDGQGLLDGLQFHYNFIFHEQIDPVTTVQLESFVTERHMELTNKGKPHLAQFIANAFAICRFQQPRPQLPMNFNRGRNDPMRDPVKIYPFRALRSCVTLHSSSLRLPLRLCGESHSRSTTTPGARASIPGSFSKCRPVLTGLTPRGSSAKFCVAVPGYTAPG